MGRIIDTDGKPFSFDPEMQSAALDIPQIASRYIEHPASGITPNRAAQCLRGAERGDLIAQSDLAADIEEKDTHLFAELGKRRLAIQGVPWSIEPPPNASANEKKDAEMLDEYLHSADWFDAMLFDATDAILKGYSCMEIEHGMLGKMHIIRAIRWRDSGHFCLNPDDLSELRLRDGSHAGVAFQPFGWIVHQSRSRTGYGGATGLVRTLIWPFIFKNYSVRDLAEFLEVYGLPMKVGKYPSGATPEQKSALMRAVMDIGRRTGGIIPAGMSLEFQAAANGQADPFETMISWGERSISKAILGGTLTTEAGDKGARSLGEVHNEVRREIRDSDLRQLAFRIWAKNIMQTRRGGNDIRTLGFMTESIAQAVESRTGTPPARLLAMSGKNVLHADSVKHQNDGIALMPEDFGRLPAMLAKPKAVLWDKRHKNLMYIVENKDGSVQIAVNAPYSLKRQPDKLDVIVNAYRVINMDKLKSDIRGGMLEVLEGQID